MKKTFGYARVSTAKQHAEAQLELLQDAGCDEVFVEVQSGSNRQRPELEKLLARLREGDTLVVVKLDRLSRSLQDLLAIAQEIEKHGAHLRSLQDSLIDTTSPNGKLIFGMFAVLAEYERDLIRARTLEGLAAARARGQRQKSQNSHRPHLSCSPGAGATLRSSGSVKPRTEGQPSHAPTQRSIAPPTRPHVRHLQDHRRALSQTRRHPITPSWYLGRNI